MFKKIVFLAAFSLYLTACQQNETQSTTIQKTPFFDLAVYFEAEISRLKKNNTRFQKKFNINGKEEEKIVENINLEEELAAFSAANINKTTWLDLYTVDSTFIEQQLSSLHYKTAEEKLEIKEVDIFFKEAIVNHIVIKKEQQTILASTQQQMEYHPQKGFSIDNKQQMRFTDEQKLFLEVSFL